jgi:hypothetical protein
MPGKLADLSDTWAASNYLELIRTESKESSDALSRMTEWRNVARQRACVSWRFATDPIVFENSKEIL